MRHFEKLILILLCIALLTVPAAAASAAESVRADAVVESDGSCQVTVRLQLRLEQGEKLVLPLPDGARDVRLDGKYKTPTQQGARLVLALPELGAGVHTVEVSFRLDSILSVKNGVLWLEVPLLSGFSYPVERFAFSVRFPAAVPESPGFTSGYYGQDILSSMETAVQGSTLSGSCTKPLKDHETLTLTCRVNREDFPAYSEKAGLLGPWELTMAVLMAVAAVYYLFALMPSIPKKIRSFSPPEGLSAGDLGTCLTGCGMDLTMMVFSWAQLGYLDIEIDNRGRVWLHKRMEMGSERPNLEIRCFQVLFRQPTVDGASLHYARLCRKMATKSWLLKQIYRSRSGNPQIVRLLSVAAGALSGVLLSRGVYTAGAGTVLLAIAMVLVCGVLSWAIQAGSRCIPLGNKLPIWLGALCGGLWLGLGLLMQNPVLAGLMVVYEGITGLAAAVGGRRSEAGKHYLSQIRGLRVHLTRASVFDMQQCQEKNPNYFFELMPYALALGVEKPFARRFGKVKLAECSYLTAPVRGALTPLQWAAVLRQAADKLNRRQRRLKYEQLLQQAEGMVKSR